MVKVIIKMWIGLGTLAILMMIAVQYVSANSTKASVIHSSTKHTAAGRPRVSLIGTHKKVGPKGGLTGGLAGGSGIKRKFFNAQNQSPSGSLTGGNMILDLAQSPCPDLGDTRKIFLCNHCASYAKGGHTKADIRYWNLHCHYLTKTP